MDDYLNLIKRFKVGDKVIVTQKWPSASGGWLYSWIPEMDFFVGKECIVKQLPGLEFDSGAGICIEMLKPIRGLEFAYYWFPPQVLRHLTKEYTEEQLLKEI